MFPSRYLCLSFLLLLACNGCTPLKEVSAYALASKTTMDKASAAGGYGYFDFCYDSALVYSKNPAFSRDVDCDCNYGTTSDTVLRHAYDIISTYFAALAKLADAKTRIQTGPIGNAIPAGTYGGITFTSTEAGILNALTTAAQDLLTNSYKSNKIRQVLGHYHDTVSLAITKLMELERSHRNLIRAMSNKFRGTIDGLSATTNAKETQLMLIALYRENSLRWELAAAAAQRQYEALQKVRDGHDTLYQNLNTLNESSVRKKVLGFAQNIIYLSQ